MTMKPTKLHHSASGSGRAQGGFTLVELLVAIALGLLVMIALIAVFTNVNRTNSEMSKTNSMIENGRFAVDVLNDDIMHAGYWGGYVPLYDSLSTRSVVPTGVPATATVALGPCVDYAAWDVAYRDMLLGVPVEAYRDAPPTGCSTATVVKDRKPGTDVLVVRHAETCLPGTPNCEALDTAKVYVQASQCAAEIEAGTRYVVSNSTTDFVLHVRGCTVPAGTAAIALTPIAKFVQHIYYVRTWSTTDGDGIPTLVRSTFGKVAGLPAHEPAQALIEGVEALGIELGVDSQGRCAGSFADYTQALVLGPTGNLQDPATCSYNAATITKNTLPTVRGDGVPDSWVRCAAAGCTAAELRDVVAVKLFVLARSREGSPLHVDGKTYNLGSGGTDTLTVTPAGADVAFKRHVFQTTVRLVNIAGRRETPKP